jgi:hypothetical protein|tara:strand:- start:200 stop:640 length:441 start_codon:yes stop_codon:yes gene_type:complete
MIRKFKIFWDKFTTRFAVPLLIVSMVWNTYLGWESRTNARAAEYRLKSYILEHRHLPVEENIYTITSVDGEEIEIDESTYGEVDWRWLKENGWEDMIPSPMDNLTPEGISDIYLGKIFNGISNIKSKIVNWYESLFKEEYIKTMRG